MGTGAAVGHEARSAGALGSPRLFVFVPALERTRAVEEILSEGLSGIAVTAFGRFADFSAAIASERPEGALSLVDTLRVLGIPPGLQAEAGGSAQERYVVLSKDQSDSLEQLASKAMGVVDIVGRAELPRLLKGLLGLKAPPVVKRVLKIGDLLPLLHLELAPAVTLPERFQTEFQKMSRLNLRILRPSTAFLGRAALGFPTGRVDGAIVYALHRAPPSVGSLLGAEAWR